MSLCEKSSGSANPDWHVEEMRPPPLCPVVDPVSIENATQESGDPGKNFVLISGSIHYASWLSRLKAFSTMLLTWPASPA